MLYLAELIHRALLPFLIVGGSLLGILLAFLLVQRLLRELAFKRRQAVVAQYQPLIDAIVQFGPTPHAIERLRQAPAAHLRVIADLLLSPLHAVRGDVVSRVRDAATAIGLIDGWRADLQNRRWWLRANGIRALGFVEDPSAIEAILRMLDDGHEEVRAAAVEALGRLGDPRAVTALLGHLGDGSRYQRARVVDALRSLGPGVTPALVELGRAQPAQTRLAVDVLAMIGTAEAIDPLLQWCGDPRNEVRAAALGALGSLGLDDRSYYFALRGLGDADPQARAMAARALGRGGREDAVEYLARRLDDEWLPAAQAAGALRRLGPAGRTALQARARDEGQAGDLARQMLWAPQPIATQA